MYGLGGTAIPVHIICWQWIGGWCWREQQQARLASSSAFFLFYLWHAFLEMSPFSVFRSFPWQIEVDIDRAVFSTDRY
jgi:hypothetical protein